MEIRRPTSAVPCAARGGFRNSRWGDSRADHDRAAEILSGTSASMKGVDRDFTFHADRGKFTHTLSTPRTRSSLPGRSRWRRFTEARDVRLTLWQPEVSPTDYDRMVVDVDAGPARAAPGPGKAPAQTTTPGRQLIATRAAIRQGRLHLHPPFLVTPRLGRS